MRFIPPSFVSIVVWRIMSEILGLSAGYLQISSWNFGSKRQTHAIFHLNMYPTDNTNEKCDNCDPVICGKIVQLEFGE